MKRHKRMNRRMTDRLKSTVSVLLVSSMVLNPLSGIQTAIGSELNSTRVTVKGSKASINLSSAALREAASYAIQNGVTFTPEAYVGLDTATDAAFENILTQGSSLYELDLFDAEDQNVFTEAGINVKLLIQKDPKSADADLDTASASDLKRKTNVSFDYQAKDNRGKEILFYQKGSALDSLIGNFMLEDIKHTELTEAETAEDNSTYELTGSETVTILYMNTDKDAHTFSLSVDGKAFSGSVKVEGNESAVSKLKKQLKKTAKEELTGTTEATAEVTEATIKAAETESSAKTENSATTESSAVAETSTVAESSAVTQDNVVASEAATKAEETTTAAETAETTITAAVKETKNSKKEAETQTAEVSQEETTAKETKAETSKAEKTEKAESVAEAVTKEVEQISGENTVTAIGAYTLQSFFEEGEAQEVKIVEETSKAAEEKIAESEKETEAETTKASKEETTAAETTAEAKAEKETTAAETTAVNKETTTAETTAENKESTAAAEATTAAETTAAESKVETAAAATEETKEPETKAITSMDESLAEERNKLLSEQTVADLAVNTVSAKAVQYTLDDLTSDFKSADLGAYLVKVYPVDKNAVDDSWTLKATELLKEEQTDADAKTEAHETMKSETAEALKEAGIYDNSVSLDIHFEDANGNEKEPNGKVRVEIEVAKEILEEKNAIGISIYHLKENAAGEVETVEKLADAENTKELDEKGNELSKKDAIVTETVQAENAETTTEVKKLAEDVEKVQATFVTDSFSEWGIELASVNTAVGTLTIKDTTTENGKFSVENPNSSLKYVWYICNEDGSGEESVLKENQSNINVNKAGDILTDATDSNGVACYHSELNVVQADVYFSQNKTDKKSYYMVKALDSEGNVVAKSSPMEVSKGYYEVQNGGFEKPVAKSASSSHTHGGSDIVWSTTASDKEIEFGKFGVSTYYEYGQKKDNCWQYYGIYQDGTTKNDNGTQFAELNAGEEGALYQDVITAPNTKMKWSLEHSARHEHRDYASAFYRDKNDSDIKDTMYLLVMPSSVAEKITSQDAIKSNNLLTENGCRQFERNNNLPENSVYVETITDSVGWASHAGTYVVPSGQYRTRFYFVAGETAYGGNKTVGNLLDNIQFSTSAEIDVTKFAKINVEKIVEGVDIADLSNYTVNVELNSDSAELQNFAADGSNFSKTQNGVLELNMQSGSVAQDVTVSESVSFVNEAAKAAFEAKYESDGEPTYQIVKGSETKEITKGTDGKYTTSISSAGEYTIVITNKYKKKLTVTKTFEGLEENERPSDFKIEISGNGLSTAKELKLDDNNVVKSSDGKTYTWTVNGLTSGKDYTVTETPGTAPTGYELKGVKIGSETVTPSDGKYSTEITYGTNNSVAFANTYEKAKKTLTIEKTVTGTGASVDSNGYTFSLGITKADGTALTDADKATIASWNTSVMTGGYSDTVTVKPTAVETAGKASVKITLPAGYKYQVKENKSNCENYTTTIAGVTGEETKVGNVKYYGMKEAATLTADTTISFTNTYDIPTPAGIHRDILPYVISMGIALAGAALLLLENQRKRRLSR